MNTPELATLVVFGLFTIGISMWAMYTAQSAWDDAKHAEDIAYRALEKADQALEELDAIYAEDSEEDGHEPS